MWTFAAGLIIPPPFCLVWVGGRFPIEPAFSHPSVPTCVPGSRHARRRSGAQSEKTAPARAEDTLLESGIRTPRRKLAQMTRYVDGSGAPRVAGAATGSGGTNEPSAAPAPIPATCRKRRRSRKSFSGVISEDLTSEGFLILSSIQKGASRLCHKGVSIFRHSKKMLTGPENDKVASHLARLPEIPLLDPWQ